jgi:predicted methyltransferase
LKNIAISVPQQQILRCFNKHQVFNSGKDMIRKLGMVALLATSMIGSSSLAAGTQKQDALATALASTQRSEVNRARDQYRHPRETLSFFGVKQGQNVVELWPGAGWYTEILAPWLAGKGQLTVATPAGRSTEAASKWLDARPALFAKVKRAGFPARDGVVGVPAGSADVVLTFRNVHNWRFGGTDQTQEAFNQIYIMLKPGGVLGVVEHRLPETMDNKLEEKSGYMKRSSVVGFATKAGFKLAGESDINANAKDTHDWPDGVWTLPPVYRLGETDRAKYAAIGESDRMTLKFVKPKK